MTISDLVLIEVRGEFPVEESQGRESMSRPLGIYPELGESARCEPAHKPGDVMEHSDVYLEVRTDEGATGLFGPVDGRHAIILRREMREFLIGRDPLAIEKMWDLLLRREVE